MADNSSSTNSNSWTLLSPEVKESGVESVGPLSEGEGDLQPEHSEPAAPQQPEQSETPSGQLHTAEPPQVAPLEGSDAAALPHDSRKEDNATSSSPAHVKSLTFLSSDSGEHEASAGSHESKAHLDADLFSDSYTHVRPTLPKSVSHPAASHGDDEERPELRKTLSEESKSDVDENRNDGDGLRRRNVSLLTSLEHTDDEEEEQDKEEQFRPPQRGEDIGFSLNKCIFGALVLLGLGTIFFSGMFMELDDEGDGEVKDQKYPEIKKDWLNANAHEDLAGVQPPEIMEQLARESQQISILQAQLQHQEMELKMAKQNVEEGTKERLRWEELEMENQRLREELNKLPSLQKELEQENERVKKELEDLPALQKELELLRDKVTELSASAQAGAHSAERDQELKPSEDQQEIKEIKDRKSWKKEGKKDPSTEWKKDRRGKVEEKEKSESAKEQKKWNKDNKEQEKSKSRRGKGETSDVQKEKQDGGRRGKHFAKHEEEKREFKEGKGKNEWREDKKWKKEQHEESSDFKQEKKGKYDKQGRQKSEQNDWKKAKQADQEDKRLKEKKKARTERENWEGERDTRSAGDEKHKYKEQKEKTWKGEKSYREREETHQARKGNDGERSDRWKEEKKHKEKPHKHDEKWKKGKDGKSHNLYSERKHRKNHMHGNYWTEQREKLWHFYGALKGCTDVTSCAHAEGLVPVSRMDFEAFLSGYLMNLQGSEEQTTRNEELNKLIGEFFIDGVFVHDRLPFSEFVEDVGDILEDLAEDAENEIKGFEQEAMERFLETVRTEDKARQSGRKRSSG